MAKKTIEELTQFILNNSRIADDDDRKASLAYAPADFEKIIRKIKDALPSNSVTSSRIVSSTTGDAERAIYIQKQYEEQAIAVIKNAIEGMDRGTSYDYSMNNSLLMQNFQRTLHGKEAIALAKKQVEEAGGIFTPAGIPSNPDRFKISLPSDVNAKDLLSSATASSSAFVKSKHKEDAQKAEEQNQAHQLKEIARQKKDTDRAKSDAEKLIDKAIKDEEKAKKDEERKQKAEIKENLLFKSRVLIGIHLAIKVFNTVADITRRILTLAFENASKTREQTTTANNLGMTIKDVRQYGYTDTALGLKEGTVVGAIQDIQDQFGDPTKLNNASLEVLAKILGSNVEKFVRSGLNGEKPEKLMELALNKAFELYKNGIDPLTGAKVGQEQSRRDIITLLKQISPNLASLSAKMMDSYSGGIYSNQFGNWDEFKKLTAQNIGSSEATLKMVRDVGEAWDKLKAKIEATVQTLSDSLTEKFGGLIDWANNLTIGMNDKEKEELWKQNRERLEKRASELQSKKSEAHTIGLEVLKEAGIDTKGGNYMASRLLYAISEVVKNPEYAGTDASFAKAIVNNEYFKANPEKALLLIRALATEASSSSFATRAKNEAGKTGAVQYNDVAMGEGALEKDINERINKTGLAKKILPKTRLLEEFESLMGIKMLSLNDILLGQGGIYESLLGEEFITKNGTSFDFGRLFEVQKLKAKGNYAESKNKLIEALKIEGILDEKGEFTEFFREQIAEKLSEYAEDEKTLGSTGKLVTNLIGLINPLWGMASYKTSQALYQGDDNNVLGTLEGASMLKIKEEAEKEFKNRTDKVHSKSHRALRNSVLDVNINLTGKNGTKQTITVPINTDSGYNGIVDASDLFNKQLELMNQ